MAVLRSRPLPNGFGFVDGLQLGKGLTYAEEAFRKVLPLVFGAGVTILQREIIVPNEKYKPELLCDPDGLIMKGDLAESVAQKNWSQLTLTQRNKIDGDVCRCHRKRCSDDFEKKTVFFRATINLEADPEVKQKAVCSRVEAYALSGWWHLAVVQVWCQKQILGVSSYVGTEYQIDGHILQIVPWKEWKPPKFLAN